MFCVASYLTNTLSLRVLELADVDLHTIPILLRNRSVFGAFLVVYVALHFYIRVWEVSLGKDPC